jgi:hypothetical protein
MNKLDLTPNFQDRLDDQLKKSEERRLNDAFAEALTKLREKHSDLGADQFTRWEDYLVEKDQLALGAAMAMMGVRKARCEGILGYHAGQ